MRWFRVAAPSFLAAAIVLFVACAGSDDVAPGPAPTDGGTDSALLGDTTEPVSQADAEPLPGDVCGDRRGLDVASAWPLRGGCPTRAGWSSLAGPQTGTVGFNLGGIPAGSTSPVVGGNGVVWVGTEEGDLLAIASGVPRWAHRTGGPVRSSPAVDVAGNAVAGSSDGTLYAVAIGDGPVFVTDAGIDPDSGLKYAPAKRVWSVALGPIASSPVIGGDGTIYVGTLDGHLHAVPRGGASAKWTRATHDTLGSSPALGQDGTVYVGSSDHKLYAFHPDGSAAFALDLGAELTGSPAVGGDGTIYIGGADGVLHAVSPTGTVRWSYSTGGAIRGTPAVYAGVVYVGSEDKRLHAVSVADGRVRFTHLALGAVATPAIGPDGTVYAGATDARLYALSPKGTLLFAVNVRGRVTAGPAIAPGSALYVNTDNGVVLVGP